MGLMLDDIEHLSREIGPRPAGTEEERVAAMYIAEKIQKRSGIASTIEDFDGAKGINKVYNFVSIISSILFFVAILLTIVTIPMFVVTLILAVLVVLEFFNKQIVSNFLRFGVSQNVVAKYIPVYSTNNQNAVRKRKVVLVSHYDSGKAVSGQSDSYFKLRKIARAISIVVCCIIPIFLLIKGIVFPETSGSMTLFTIIFAIVLVVLAIMPIILDFYESKMLYNEAANCNASGNAALIEIARQLGTGAYNLDSDDSSQAASNPVVHGKEVALDSDVVPEDAQINYDNIQQNVESSQKNDDPLVKKEKSLESAKAAVAAFLAPRKPRSQYDAEGNVLDDKKDINEGPQTQDIKFSQTKQVEEKHSTDIDNISAKVELPKKATDEIPKASGEVPSWFKSAQSKANKQDDANKEELSSKRSRFAHTIDVLQEKKDAEQRAKQVKEEKEREKLRQQIIEANKQAEAERKKKFGQEKPFFRDDENKSQVSAKDSTANEKMSIDESFKLHQKQNTPVQAISDSNNQKNIEENQVENTIDTSSDVNSDMPVPATHGEYIQASSNVEDSSNNKATESDVSEINKNSNEDQQDLTQATVANEPINLDQMQQYAPLDDQSFISSNEMPENSTMIELPEVFSSDQDIEKDPKYVEALKQTPTEDSSQKIERGKFGTGSFAAVSENEGVAGATGTFAPVTEELIEDASTSGKINTSDMVVSDADDSVYSEGSFTDTGAFAGNDYVDIPKEKGRGLFKIFGKKKKNKGPKHSDTAKSFDDIAPNDKGDNIIDDAAWSGGAFSLKDKKLNIGKSFKKNTSENKELSSDIEQQDNTDQPLENIEDFNQPKNNDLPITHENHRVNAMMDPVPDFEEQIQDFHKSSINIEVWMVALGSEINENAGIKAFLMEHAQELHGSIIIDVEALGAGDFSLVNSEGILGKTETAPRLKRYVRKAANKLNFSIPSIDVPWGSSSAAYANKCGYKTLRLAGMSGSKPALYMEKEDVIENIDESKLKENVKYIFELIQSI